MASLHEERTPGPTCLACGYHLKGITEPRCPECGRPFNPNDPKTYDSRCTRPHRWLEVYLALTAAYPLLVLAFAYSLWFYGWMRIGEPPRKYIHDPKNVLDDAFVLVLVALLMLMGCAPALGMTLLGILLGVARWCWSVRYRTRSLLFMMMFAIAAWSGWFLIMRWDPVEIWIWIGD